MKSREDLRKEFKEDLRVLLERYNACINSTAGNNYMSMWITGDFGQITVCENCTIPKCNVLGLDGGSKCLK